MNDPDDPVTAALERAFEALDAGDPEALACELMNWPKLGVEDPLAFVFTVHVELLRGEWKAAARRLELARASVSQAEPELFAVAGEFALCTWRADQAIDEFRRALELEPRADLHLRLALAFDLLDRPEEAERCLEQARALEPVQFANVRHYNVDRFEALVVEAAERLPESFRAVLEEVAVVLDPVPRAELASGREAETPPDLLGLFVGASALERSIEGLPESPAVIYLFQRNLERFCRDEDELAEQVAVTLYHELGHALGFDEDGVDRLGLA